jgi:hypothetical protein
VTDKGAPALAQLTSLRILDLRGTSVGDEGLALLTALKELRDLDLSESIVGNTGLEALRQMPHLTHLNLWAARVGDAGMPALAQVKTLVSLNLDNVGYPDEKIELTDAGVAHLTSLENLEWLHLGKTAVGDAGLMELAKLPKLKELTITFCPNVTDSGVSQLQAARPDLKITR